MFNKAIVVLCMLFCGNVFLSFLSSCRTGQRGNEHCKTTYCYRIDSLYFTPYDETTLNKLQYPYSVSTTNLRLDLDLMVDVSVCFNKPARRSGNLSLFSTAYAYTPPPCRVSFGNDSIVAYNIYSNNDYDPTHPAGSSLNDRFSSNSILSFSYYDEGQGQPGPSFSFFVEHAPADTGRHIFTLALAKKSGDTVSVSTPSILLR